MGELTEKEIPLHSAVFCFMKDMCFPAINH